ncbi:MAG TPA: peptide ABC transporter substrate-binding protein [Chloroflexia bacterium]|nr:peptide ABC transporter substrate-binding protein [Chloroflexia bacterium]
MSMLLPIAGPRRAARAQRAAAAGLLAVLIGLAGCGAAAGPLRPGPGLAAPPFLARAAQALPTATVPGTPPSRPGHYENGDLGVAFDYPATWTAAAGKQANALTILREPEREIVVVAFYGSLPAGSSLQDTAQKIRDANTTGLSNIVSRSEKAIQLADGRAAWVSELDADQSDGTTLRIILTSAARGGRIVSLLVYGLPIGVERQRRALEDMTASLHLSAPQLYGISRDQALVEVGGESNNPRDYDPATGGHNALIFSGLVTFNQQLEVVPDLAESWEISPDGTVYTFHLRKNARFHNGRAVTTADVIYSWERAAAPATNSDDVLTYLGDIVGIQARHDGKADHIAGLHAVDDQTLQVTIDAPKPYFLMKLTYGVSSIVDRANVESGPAWYRTPNGTGPYKLIRWDAGKLQLYERNPDFYLGPPAIRYVIQQLYAGVGIRLYETGDIDFTGVSRYDVARVRDPQEPLHQDLREGVSMCTSKITFDVRQAPFDDPKVRQAFALAVDKQRYLDIALQGVGLPAHGLYPPALPGYNPGFKGQTFDPVLARQRLAESRYHDAAHLPPIVFTTSGYGSDVGPTVSALIAMWQANLGVAVTVENLEPDHYIDELHAGRHGQLLSDGWCADYPDPENFADALFHSGAQQNLGHYANPALDTLLEKARVERDVAQRMALYQQAEGLIVDDAAAIFLSHGLSFVLVKPYVQGYVLTPIGVPLERYLSIDPAQLK